MRMFFRVLKCVVHVMGHEAIFVGMAKQEKIKQK